MFNKKIIALSLGMEKTVAFTYDEILKMDDLVVNRLFGACVNTVAKAFAIGNISSQREFFIPVDFFIIF